MVTIVAQNLQINHYFHNIPKKYLVNLFYIIVLKISARVFPSGKKKSYLGRRKLKHMVDKTTNRRKLLKKASCIGGFAFTPFVDWDSDQRNAEHGHNDNNQSEFRDNRGPSSDSNKDNPWTDKMTKRNHQRQKPVVPTVFEGKPIEHFAIQTDQHPSEDIVAFSTSALGQGFATYVGKGIKSPSEIPSEIACVDKNKLNGILDISWKSKNKLSYDKNAIEHSRELKDIKHGDIRDRDGDISWVELGGV